LDLRFVEVVLGFAHLLGVEVPVGGAGLEAAALGVDHGLDPGELGAGARGGGGYGVGQQPERDLGGAGHLVGDAVGGVAGVAQQLGLARAQFGQALDGGAGVVGVALLGAAQRGGHQLLAQAAVGKRAQRGLLGGVLQGEQPLAVVPGGLGGIGGGGQRAL